MTQLPKFYRQFSDSFSKVFRAYEKLGEAASQAGPLDARTRELVKLGMAAAQKSESAVKSHTHRALDAGCGPEDVQHAVLLGVTTMGFPAMMTALSWVQEALAAHQG